MGGAAIRHGSYDAYDVKAVPSSNKLAQAPFIVNFTQVDADGDGIISMTEFQAACGKGLVKSTNP